MHQRIAIALLLLLGLGALVSPAVTACGAWPEVIPDGSARTPLASNQNQETLDPPLLRDVRFWAYQIQRISDAGAVDALVNSRYDMLVVEPTRTDWSSDETKGFNTRLMVNRLKASLASDGVHRKLVFAYIDIGEAENWRWYWTWSKDWQPGTPRPSDWPDYIVTQDPDGWAGNFPVAYWNPHWRDIIIYGQTTGLAPDRDYKSALDEVINDGFDGVYLDWVEAFSSDQVIAAAKQAGVDPASEMIKFIKDLREYGRQRIPGFQVIQQNATALLDGHPELLNFIDAIGQEDTWYRGQADVDWNDPRGYDEPQDPAYTRVLTSYLERYRAAGKPVFTIDYAVTHAREVYELVTNSGYIPYCSRTALSQLTTTPPPNYP